MDDATKQSGKVAFHWQPNGRILLFVVIFLPLTIFLGFWQLGRADEKQALLEESTLRQQSAPVALETVDLAAANQYRPVVAVGRFDNDHSVLLDNRVRRGQAGYEVITPFQLSPSGAWVLVNRGWIEANASRNKLPDIDVVDGLITLNGYLYSSPGKPFTLGEEQWRSSWPQVLQNLDMPLLGEKLGIAVAPVSLRLRENSPAAYEVGWEVVNVQPQKHVGYAVQWFAMAVALAILALFANSNLSALMARRRR